VTPDLVLQAGLDGVVVGAMISLAALGLTLVWGVERFANIAQGDTLTVAAYFAFGLSSGLGLPLLAAAPAAVGATVLLVLLTERLVFRPITGAPRVALLVASIGVALLYRGAISLMFGTRLQGYDIPAQRAISFGPVRVTPFDLAILGIVAVMLAIVYIALFRTRTGMEMRAVADLPALARVSGIDSRRVLQITWGLAASITAVGGILLGAKLGLTPMLGWNLLLLAFAATVLGSVGNPLGAVVGGIVLGLVTELSAVFVSPTFKPAIAFVILALILLFRPRGLFGRA
jgi:branched-subunit amino acid ABC-type transport system permease component